MCLHQKDGRLRVPSYSDVLNYDFYVFIIIIQKPLYQKMLYKL